MGKTTKKKMSTFDFDKNVINNRLISLRKQNQYTQKDIASYLNVGFRTVSNYEHGQNQYPIEVLVALSKLYHVSLDYIVGEEHSVMDQQVFLLQQNHELRQRNKKLEKENERLTKAVRSALSSLCKIN